MEVRRRLGAGTPLGRVVVLVDEPAEDIDSLNPARVPAAWLWRNWVQLGPLRRGAGSRWCRRRMVRTDVADTVTPSLRHFPAILR